MVSSNKDPEVTKQILSLFRLDKLCPKCNGPMEKRNTVSCNYCRFLSSLKTQVDIIESGCMSIRHNYKLKREPVKHNVRQSKQKPKKKPIPKKRSTKKKNG